MLAESVVEWTQEWKQQGLDEGRKEGRKEGQCELLGKQLEHRFGPLDASARERLAKATPEQIERWAERVLDAPSLEDVMAD